MSSVRERRMMDDAPVTRGGAPEREGRDGPGRDATLAAGFNLAIGLWLVGTPWVFGYADSDPWWNPTLAGLVVASCAGGRLLGDLSETVLSRVNFAIGAWLILSGVWLPPSSGAALSNATCGVLVVLLALLGIASSRALARESR